MGGKFNFSQAEMILNSTTWLLSIVFGDCCFSKHFSETIKGARKSRWLYSLGSATVSFPRMVPEGWLYKN